MAFLRVAHLIILVILTSACGKGSSGGDSNASQFSTTPLQKNINGFIVKSIEGYLANNSLVWTDTYSIDNKKNIITVDISGQGQESYYYNASGQTVKYRFTHRDDPDADGHYPKSNENYFQYNHSGLISYRTRDLGIDGQMNSSQTWSYDHSGKLMKREYDSNYDGTIETVVTYTWNNLGQKQSRTETSMDDDSSTTFSYFYSDNSVLPMTRYEDKGSDGTVDSTLYYSFDDNGNLTRYSYHNRSGALVMYYLIEYESAGGEIAPNLMLRNFNIYE